MNALRGILLAGAQNPWLHRQAMRRGFVKRAVTRFMPGETLDDALAAARTLAADRKGAILTHLGENVADLAEANAEARHYVEVIDRVAEIQDAEVSIKLTQLGLDVDPERAYAHAAALAERANARRSRLWIDMEGSTYTGPTLDMYRRLRSAGADVGVCLQSYLRRTRDDLESLLPLGPAIRLVKGAYREAPEIAFPDKRDVDANYAVLAERLLSDEARGTGAWLTVATHDPVLIERVRTTAKARGVATEAYEYAMLYGIQRGLQDKLVAGGARLRVLISYGSHWFPWYMRRLAERPANVMFVVRSLFQ